MLRSGHLVWHLGHPHLSQEDPGDSHLGPPGHPILPPAGRCPSFHVVKRWEAQTSDGACSGRYHSSWQGCCGPGLLWAGAAVGRGCYGPGLLWAGAGVPVAEATDDTPVPVCSTWTRCHVQPACVSSVCGSTQSTVQGSGAERTVRAGGAGVVPALGHRSARQMVQYAMYSCAFKIMFHMRLTFVLSSASSIRDDSDVNSS